MVDERGMALLRGYWFTLTGRFLRSARKPGKIGPMNRKFQFSVRAMLILMFGVACFFGGVRFERERRRREDAKAAPLPVLAPIPAVVPYFGHIQSQLRPDPSPIPRHEFPEPVP